MGRLLNPISLQKHSEILKEILKNIMEGNQVEKNSAHTGRMNAQRHNNKSCLIRRHSHEVARIHHKLLENKIKRRNHAAARQHEAPYSGTGTINVNDTKI